MLLLFLSSLRKKIKDEKKYKKNKYEVRVPNTMHKHGLVGH